MAVGLYVQSILKVVHLQDQPLIKVYKTMNIKLNCLKGAGYHFVSCYECCFFIHLNRNY